MPFFSADQISIAASAERNRLSSGHLFGIGVLSANWATTRFLQANLGTAAVGVTIGARYFTAIGAATAGRAKAPAMLTAEIIEVIALQSAVLS